MLLVVSVSEQHLPRQNQTVNKKTWYRGEAEDEKNLLNFALALK